MKRAGAKEKSVAPPAAKQKRFAAPSVRKAGPYLIGSEMSEKNKFLMVSEMFISCILLILIIYSIFINIVGPRIGTPPVKSIVQCLARKKGTDDFYILKVLICSKSRVYTFDYFILA